MLFIRGGKWRNLRLNENRSKVKPEYWLYCTQIALKFLNELPLKGKDEKRAGLFGSRLPQI